VRLALRLPMRGGGTGECCHHFFTMSTKPKSAASRFTPTAHPVMKLPPKETLLAMGPEKGWELMMKREELILKEKVDPFRYGYIPPIWKGDSRYLEQHRELLVMGGNRSGKTEWAAREVVRRLWEKKQSVAWCFQTTAPNSIEMQQPRVFKYLPSEWRTARKGTVTNITFSVKGGFTESKFVAPNGSQCVFRNYSQDISTIEGGEIDIAWCDELVPIDFLETLRFRLLDRNGVLIVTFTPIEGYSPVVKDYLTGARTVTAVDAELLPKFKDDKGEKILTGYEQVPLIQLGRKDRPIIYFHTKDNPWAGWERMQTELRNETKEKILCRAYGVPTRSINNRFPLFNDRVHVIKHDWIPTTGTRYQFIDPCSGRNWAMIWAIFDSANRCFIYREWPCPDEYVEGVGYPGMWAEPDGKKADGRQGPAQKDFGFGLARYVEEIRNVENGEKIFERWMDSRYGNAQTLAKERPTTLIEEMSELGMDFTATPGDTIDEGVQMINSWLHYDRDKPISALNQPKLYISEKCKNVIYCLKEWTGSDGAKGSSKDFPDLVRYLCLSGVNNVEGDILMARGGGSY
jgi:phage terminase large subunit-like protein